MRLLTAAFVAALGVAGLARHALGQEFREQPLPLMRSDTFAPMVRNAAPPPPGTSNTSGLAALPAASRHDSKRLTARQSGDQGFRSGGPIMDLPPEPYEHTGHLSGGVGAGGPTHPGSNNNPYSYGDSKVGSLSAGVNRTPSFSSPHAYAPQMSGWEDDVVESCPSGSCAKRGGADCLHDDCDHCCANQCGAGCCLHRSGGFAEYLHWQVRNIDMAYAVPQDGIGGAGTVPLGEVGVLDFDYEMGYRLGFNVAIDCCSSVTGTFTTLESTSEDFIAIDAPAVIQPLVLFPGTFNAGFTGQAASARYAVDLRMGDIDYRAVWARSDRHHINVLAGARYASLEQSFQAIFPFAPPDGTTQVDTDIQFEGGGIRFGLEGERLVSKRACLRVYGKAVASILAGDFRASYLQTNQFNGIEAITGWRDSRVVPILETEVGVSWSNRSDRVRVSAGYYFSCWSNVVTTPEYIGAVQAGNYIDVGQDAEDTLAFEGLVARLELRL